MRILVARPLTAMAGARRALNEQLLKVPWLTRVVHRYGLLLWFGIFSLWHLGSMSPFDQWLGLDARIYHRAAVAWIAGQDPWSAGVTSEGTFHFAGLPPAVLVFAVTAWLPERVVEWGWIAGSFAAGAWVVRRLELSWWWILFPPLVQGSLNGNPGIILLALLLTRHRALEVIAAALKVYALAPMVTRRRWMGITAFLALCVVSAAVVPDLWLGWLSRSADFTGRLVSEAGGGMGMTAHVALIPLTLGSLAVIAWLEWRTLGWLAIPAAMPSSQFHCGVMALPVIRPATAVLFAIPLPGMPAVAVMAHAWLLMWDHRVTDR